MFEHPYLAYRSTEFDQEQLARAAERRRVIEERSDQLVRRQPGPVRRLAGRLLHTTDAATDAARQPERRASAGREPAPAR
ncbi:hypothetical protein [Microbacterium sp. 4-7]|uniref:hypothetical protein n=1 Tax=Microbacterium sp. 4-7 TaxID=1885327 RepID=UPI00164F09D2|nr:hypothetical protein [Microbacterium sp. 4-7]MBC6493413.1 hypothetical protein [Microbacterium sp. 4-7]